VTPTGEDEKIMNASESIPAWNLEKIVSGLRQARLEWRKRRGKNEHGSRDLPSREVLRHLSLELCGLLFPMRLGPPDLREESVDYYVGKTLADALNSLEQQIFLELRSSGQSDDRQQLLQLSRDKTHAFGEALPDLRRLLDTDVEAAYQGDPAARSMDEVLLCYPGILAIIHYRIAHTLFSLDLPLIARVISEIAHSETGVDIHPGAVIGASFFIDHGTGVVIGETAVIGDRVRFYQAVTLGAKSFPKEEDGSLRKGLRRHPIVEDDVVIYAGATVLGRITLGRGSIIGGNVWLTHSVAAGAVITQAGANQEGLEI
jgi:serine O-acetyltransferase